MLVHVTRHSSGNGFQRLRLLANRDDVAGLAVERSDVDHFTVDGDVTVSDQLASGPTGRGDTQAVYDVVKTGLHQLEQVLTRDARTAGCAIEDLRELALEDAIEEFNLCFSWS